MFGVTEDMRASPVFHSLYPRAKDIPEHLCMNEQSSRKNNCNAWENLRGLGALDFVPQSGTMCGYGVASKNHVTMCNRMCMSLQPEDQLYRCTMRGMLFAHAPGWCSQFGSPGLMNALCKCKCWITCRRSSTTLQKLVWHIWCDWCNVCGRVTEPCHCPVPGTCKNEQTHAHAHVWIFTALDRASLGVHGWMNLYIFFWRIWFWPHTFFGSSFVVNFSQWRTVIRWRCGVRVSGMVQMTG